MMFGYPQDKSFLCISVITYKVQVVIGKQMGSATTANCWLNLAGKSGNTGTVNIPKGELEFRFRVCVHVDDVLCSDPFIFLFQWLLL